MVRASPKRMGGKSFHGKSLFPRGARVTDGGVVGSKKHSMIHVQTEALYIFNTARMYLAQRTRFYQALELFLGAGNQVVPLVRRKAVIPALGALSLLLSLLLFLMRCELPSAVQDSLASDERQGKTLT